MKKCIKQLSLALCIISSSIASAQVTWFFGNRGGLKFTNNVVDSSPLPATNFSATEESAVLMDANNNVIFYTDGFNIWNGSHVKQSTPSLMGDLSSTQGISILPFPGNPGKAFIFSLKAGASSFNSGLRTSIANITNYGTASAPSYVISINENSQEYNASLLDPNMLLSERIAFTPDGNGGYWLVVHGASYISDNTSNTTDQHNFYSFHVTCATQTIAQLAATKVKSDMSGYGLSPHNASIYADSFNPKNENNAAGQMKFNSSGTRLGCVLPFLKDANGAFHPAAQLYNFNKTTGVVSNPFQFDLGFTNTGTTRDGGAYGLEFSPTSNYLYVTSCRVTNAITDMRSSIYRYPLNASGIPSGSKQQVAYTTITGGVGESIGALLLGPDGKIYASKHNATNINSLLYISNPDGTGTTYAQPIAISGYSAVGLPTTVFTNKIQTSLSVSGPSIICKGSAPTYTFGYSGLVPAYHYIAVYGSNANGDAVNASGTVISDQSQSYYYKEYAYWLTPGTPPSSIVASQLATVANCGQYYTAILSTSDKCQSNGSLIIAKATTRINCITPSFNTLIDETNENFCKLTSTPIEQNRLDDPAYGFSWRVEGLTSGGTFLLNNPPAWWSAPSKYVNTYREFNDYTIHYTGTISIPNPNPPVLTNGQFIYGHTYKITRSVWDNVCTTGATSVVTLTPVHHKNSTGSHFIQTIENFDGMDLTMVNTNSTTTGVENLNGKDDAFYVYPNPSTGVFTIELSNEEKAIMEVFDVTGKTIKSIQLTKNDRYTLDLSGYAKGMYLIKVNGDAQQMKKIILE